MTLACDIFCRVIDNYGDIGVCWRLARQLAGEHGLHLRLWVDDLATFARLAPTLDSHLARQELDGITVCHWPPGDSPWPAPADIVIEGFGCSLPPGYLAAMSARPAPPVWLNLEYLSAEDWVDSCHGLSSVHPATGLVQHFWFPGFSARTGGLLREQTLLARRDAFQADPQEQAAFWTRLGLPEAMTAARRVSLFAYENPAIAGLLEQLAAAGDSSFLAVPAGRALPDVARWADAGPLAAGDRLQRGQLHIAVLTLLATADYDHLLWACDLNAVRGEDSFVRAQWAARPLLWHIYPQEEDAHLAKLQAFVGKVGAETAMPPAWAAAMTAWNRPGTPLPELLPALPAMAAASREWSGRLAARPDLAASLLHFCRERLAAGLSSTGDRP